MHKWAAHGTHALACKTPPHARLEAQSTRDHRPRNHPRPNTMDITSAGALLQCSKDPLGQCGKIILDSYMEDKRVFAAGSIFKYFVRPPLLPADRCREPCGGGRCRGRVSPLAACQLCNYHQARRTGDYNIEAGRWVPGQFRHPF